MSELADSLRAEADLISTIDPLDLYALERIEEFSKVAQAMEESNHPVNQVLESDSVVEKIAAVSGRLANAAKAGYGSLVLDVLMSPLRKIKAVDKALTQGHIRLNKLDESAGEFMSKVPFGKALFGETEMAAKKGKRAKEFVEKTIYRATAPLSKSQKVVVPVLATFGALDIADKLQRRKGMVNEHRELMQKAASAIDQLAAEVQGLQAERKAMQEKLAAYQRKELAVEIATEMANRGMIAEDDITKTASKLADGPKDLAMVKEGLSAFHGLCDLGKIHDDGKPAAGPEVDPLTAYLQSCIR